MFEIQNKTNQRLPKFSWQSAKNTVLGSDYSLSLVFCDKKLSHKLNYQYRKKDKPTNVLSFPINKKSGEIFLDLDTIKKESLDLEKPYSKWLPYLYIHGLLHLSGLDHGDLMDKKEDLLVKKYSLIK